MPPSLEELVEAGEWRSWTRFQASRLYFSVLGSIGFMVFAVLDPAPGRRAGGLGLAIAALVFIAYERRRLRQVARETCWSLIVPISIQVSAIALTGGLDSPFLGMSAVFTCYVGAQAGRRRLVVAQAALFVALAWLHVERAPILSVPRIFGGSASSHTPGYFVTTALGQSVVCFASYLIGRALRHGYNTAMAESVRASDEVVRLSAAHAVELHAICGEISHELKNPLGTVRALVELMALDTPSPRNAERLAVMLREATRMQASLEQLLTLTRPLSPLHLAPVDLEDLCAEVCSLHEGMSAAAGVALAAPPTAGERRGLQGDFRKLRQVLVNLVQNAIEASSPGATVTVVVREHEDGARVEVEDEGKWIDAEVAARAFEPGVTTKAKGNGLGLTIARAIARQHGGDVVLRPRSPRGCVATLVLPALPPGEGAGAEVVS